MNTGVVNLHGASELPDDKHSSRHGTGQLRILMISEYPRKGVVIGGVQSAVAVLCEALSQHPDIEAINVASFRYDIEEVESEAINDKLVVQHVPAQKRFAMLSLHLLDGIRLQKIAGTFMPHIVHAQGLSSTGFLGLSTRKPVVVTVHGVGVTEIYFEGGAGWFSKVKALLTETYVRYTMHHVSKVIVPSVFSRSFHLDMREDGFVSIPNAVRMPFFEMPFAAERQKRIVFTGVIIPIKNVIGIVRAFAIVKRTIPDAQLDLVGPYPDAGYKQLIEQTIQSLKLTDVRFLGNRTSQEVAGLMQSASALVMFSHHENVPCVIAEALTVGTPVVATRVGGIPEMVDEGITGYLVEPGDEAGLAARLITLLQDSRACVAMGTQGRKASQRWRPSVVAEQTIKVYRDVLAGIGGWLLYFIHTALLLLNSHKEALSCL